MFMFLPFQTKQMKFKDSRIKLMNEILNGIKVIIFILDILVIIYER